MVLPEPKTIIGNTIGETHERIIAALIKEGALNEIQTEDNEYTWEYPSQIISHVRYPNIEPVKSDASPFSRMYVDEYRIQMRSLTPKKHDGKDFTYTYGNRYFDYPFVGCDGVVQGDGDGTGINQIDTSIIKRLIKSPSSRRAVAVGWNPVLDIGESDPPCLDLIQILLRDGTLSLTAYIRSNDMLLAWPNNAAGLSGILDHTAMRINEISNGQIIATPGPITTISTSAHIYPARDANVLRAYHKLLIEKGLLR